MELTDVELELFEMAFTLRLSVQTVLDMPYDEYLGWRAYFNKKPPGWADDYRAFVIVKAFGSKATSDQLFPSLSRLNAPAKTLHKNFKQSAAFLLISNAQGGDKLSFEGEV